MITPRGMAPGASVPTLHLVTDDALLARPDFVELASAALEAGGASVALHLRGPRTAGGSLFALAQALKGEAETRGGLLVVNDRVDVALAAGIRAVHLGGRSLPVPEALDILGPGGRVGVSVHDAEVAANETGGSAWLFVGTLYATPTHPDRAGSGTDLLRAVVEVTHVPLLGIGGVTVERVREVRDAGAHGVAVIRGVWHADDPGRAVDDYLVALA